MNEFQKLHHRTLTANGDNAFDSAGDNLLNLLFMAPYYQSHLGEVHLSDSPKEKLFSMFMRDPRHGLGYRDLGRRLMHLSKVSPQNAVLAGRFDDLLYVGEDEGSLNFWLDEIRKGNILAKKWAPRITGKQKDFAKALCKLWGIKQKDYRALIKCSETVEYRLSYAELQPNNPLEALFGQNKYAHPLVDTIDFSKVPSLAMIKYYNRFLRGEDTRERFTAYLEDVKSGKKDLKIATTTVYDIYKNRDRIDADLFFDKIEKISINCIPVIDSSSSMFCFDAYGKAMSIGHYLAKCSSYCNGCAVSFSSWPQLLKVEGSNYNEEIASLHTGDYSNTDLKKVMELLEGLDNSFPEYLVILSDMDFDQGSQQSKDKLMNLWKEKGIKTKIIWWNFNSRRKTVPETDDYGNIFLSGYSPMLLKYLEVGFDGKKFLDKLLVEYEASVFRD